jgi:hypothetical protein
MKSSSDFLCRLPRFCARGTFCAKPEEPRDVTLVGLVLGTGESKRYARPLAGAFLVYRRGPSGAVRCWEVSMTVTPPRAARVGYEARSVPTPASLRLRAALILRAADVPQRPRKRENCSDCPVACGWGNDHVCNASSVSHRSPIATASSVAARNRRTRARAVRRT